MILDRWRVVLLAFAGLLAVPMLVAADDDSIVFRLSQDDRRIRVEVHGKFTLTKDRKGIASLSRGTTMRLEEDEVGGAQRRLDVEPAGDGSPVYTWRVNGEQHAFDAQGRQWLQHMLVTGRLVPEAPATGLRSQEDGPGSQ